jgi:hypothetical protein
MAIDEVRDVRHIEVELLAHAFPKCRDVFSDAGRNDILE